MKRIILLVLLIVIFAQYSALAETEVYYIICTPDSKVNARILPNKRASVVGWYECGDYVKTDDIIRNGFVHIIDASLEVSEAWIHKGYLIKDKPQIINIMTTVVSSGRVACRKYIGGKRIRWVKPDSEIKVIVRSDNWCITNRGWIQTKYLGVN